MNKTEKNISINTQFPLGRNDNAVEWVTKGDKQSSTAFAEAKGVKTMNEPDRTQWEKRCAFNSCCKKAMKCEASNAHRDVKRHQMREVTFSDLTPQEESQLYTVDRYFAERKPDDNAIRVAGKIIPPELLAEALRTLPEDKRTIILLHYFSGMTDVEIGKKFGIPRSTVQYRRTSTFEQLRRYLEERAYDDEEL